MKVFTFVLALIALAVLLRILRLPMRAAYKLIFNTLGGYVGLILINLFSIFTGAAFSMNIVTAVVVGFLGLPGIILLFLVRLMVV